MTNKSCIQKFRSENQIPFTQISNDMLWDTSISPQARALLAALLSLPVDWVIIHCDLQKRMGMGEKALNNALDQLVKAGYAIRERTKDAKGRFTHYDYKISWYKEFATVDNSKSPDAKREPGQHSQNPRDKTPPHNGLNQTSFSSLDKEVLQTKETKNKELTKRHSFRDCGNVDKCSNEQTSRDSTYQHSPQSLNSSFKDKTSSSSSSFDDELLGIWDEVDKQRASNGGPFSDRVVARWMQTYGIDEVYQAILHAKPRAKNKPESYVEKSLQGRWWEKEKHRERARSYEKNKAYSFR